MINKNRMMLLLVSAITLFASVPASPGDIEADAEHEAKLFIKVKELSLNDVTLEQALVVLQEKTHANIYLDQGCLNRAGYVSDKTIHLHLFDLELNQILSVLVAVYAPPEFKMGFGLRNGIIHVATVEALETSKSAVTLVYDVHDFEERFLTPNDLEAAGSRPTVLTGAPGSGQVWQPAPPSTTQSTNLAIPGIVTNFSRQENADMLIRLIQETVYTNSWRDNGGGLGTIKEIGGLLIVTHSPETHKELALMLKNLRKMRDAIDRGDPDRGKGIDLLKK